MKNNILLLVAPLLLLSSCTLSNPVEGQQMFEIPYGEKYINAEVTGAFGGYYQQETFVFKKDGKVTVTLNDVRDDEAAVVLDLHYTHSDGYMIIGNLVRCEINEKFMVYYPQTENKYYSGRLYYVCFNENHPHPNY